MKKKLLAALFVCVAMSLCMVGCGNGGYDQEALHINYGADDNYGTEDYLGTTLTIAGSGVSSETQYTVKEIEELANSEETLQYQGEYSMMSRGGEFSEHLYTGIKLYELLQECGLDKNLAEDTPVRFVSVDGYALTMDLGEIINRTDSTFKAKTDNQPSLPNAKIFGTFSSDG